jgi:hypothetical protein
VNRWFILWSYSWTQTVGRNPPTAFIFWVTVSRVLSSSTYTQFNDRSLQSRLITEAHRHILHNSHSHTPSRNIFFVTAKASDCVKSDILPQNMAYYYKTWHITTKCDILPQNVAYYQKTWRITTKRGVLPQNMTYYHKTWHITTKCDILPHNMAYYHKTWHITTNTKFLRNTYSHWDILKHWVPPCSIPETTVFSHTHQQPTPTLNSTVKTYPICW